MPYYACRATGDDGRVIARGILATSPEECRKSLEAEGYLVLSVRRDWKTLQAQGLRLGRKIKDKDFILFNQELVALIRSGYPILRSLEAISSRQKNVYLREVLTKAGNEVKLGKALSEAFQPYERVFGTVYTASLMAGERSGNLPGSLTRYIQYAKVISQTRSRVRSALAYPTILIIFAFILFTILVNFILPRFAGFYQDFQAQLPGITRLIMSVAMALNAHWYVIPAVLAALVVIYVSRRKRPDFRLRLDRLKLRVPFGRGIWIESSVAMFCRTLGLLLEAGITLLQSIGIAIQSVPNASLAARMRGVPDSIKNGEGLSDSLAKAKALPPLALDMIRIGETSANLQGMLGDVADFYDDRIRVKIDTLVSLIEPVVIIFMGLVVAGMLLAIYLPIFNVIRIAR
ncbi:MAG TPA: type II secretion system F family protein [Burkholderiales bacterium]|nr:type II secretion system F family protein [Burkholderiales bacterium]